MKHREKKRCNSNKSRLLWSQCSQKFYSSVHLGAQIKVTHHFLFLLRHLSLRSYSKGYRVVCNKKCQTAHCNRFHIEIILTWFEARVIVHWAGARKLQSNAWRPRPFEKDVKNRKGMESRRESFVLENDCWSAKKANWLCLRTESMWIWMTEKNEGFIWCIHATSVRLKVKFDRGYYESLQIKWSATRTRPTYREHSLSFHRYLWKYRDEFKNLCTRFVSFARDATRLP